MTESIGTVTAAAYLLSNMTVSEEDTATMTHNSSSGQAKAEELPLHPGYTTLISFSAAILLVVLYLYSDNFVACARRLCLRKNSVKNGGEYDNNKAPLNSGTCGNGDLIAVDAPAAPVQTSAGKTGMEEPGVVCDCGQIHLLRECMNEAELHAYRDILDKIETGSPERHVTISRFSSDDETRSPGKSPRLSSRGAAVVPLVLDSGSGQSVPGLTIPNIVYTSPGDRSPSVGDAIA